MEIVLKTNNLTKIYGMTKAVNDLNMTIYKGDIYGFIGRNGAGKTTLIRLITDLSRKSSGEYTLFGINDNMNLKEVRRKMSAIVETPSLYLNLNAKDNLRIQGHLVNCNDEDKFKEILKIVGLESVGKKRVKDFSLGMKQRLSIGVSLLGDPEFLLLDEPMNGLDPEGIIEVRNILLNLKEKGKTILISSHILGELSKIANRYGFINNGRMIEEISSADLEEKCKKYIKITVEENENMDNVKKALNELQYTINNNHILIYSNISATDIILRMNEYSIKVKEIQNNDQDIEHYYISLIGGQK